MRDSYRDKTGNLDDGVVFGFGKLVFASGALDIEAENTQRCVLHPGDVGGRMADNFIPLLSAHSTAHTPQHTQHTRHSIHSTTQHTRHTAQRSSK